MQTQSTVHIIEPDESLRQSLSQFLEAMSISSAGYRSAEDFLSRWKEGDGGCLLTELFLGGMSGLDLQRKLNGTSERIPVVFISEFADVPTAVQAVQSGAVGFLTKPFSKQTLLENLREGLARDEKRRNHEMAVSQASALIKALTRREREMLESVVRGMKNREIAEKLDLSLKTVEMHRSRMMKKMSVESVADLIRLYLLVYPDTLQDTEFFIQNTKVAK